MSPVVASSQEIDLVRFATDMVKRTEARFASLAPNRNVHPIPFVGRLASARVLTFGLNPSAEEFTERRSWPARLSIEDLAARLVGYFSNQTAPRHPWFAPWAEVLALLGSSYERDPAHIDLSPRPTVSARNFTGEPQRSLFLEMLRVDAPIWIRALRIAANVKLLMIAGSATNRYYINEFIQHELPAQGVDLRPRWLRGRGQGQTAFADLVLPDGRTIPSFFCSHPDPPRLQF